MSFGDKTYAERLVEWGNSGSFYPCLLPDEKSERELRELQANLSDRHLGSTAIKNLHVTLFYVNPRKLFDYIKQNSNPDLDEAKLYLDLTTIIAITTFKQKPLVMGFDGLDWFGQDNSQLALSLEHSDESKFFISTARELLTVAIRRCGVYPREFEEMSSVPDFKWALGESTPHLTLMQNIQGVDLDSIAIPEMATLMLDGISGGSVVTGISDAHEIKRFMWGLDFDAKKDVDY